MDMIIFYIILFVIGLLLFIFSICKLAAPSAGWKYEYHASIPQESVEIPQAGRYDICISHYRFALLKGRPVTANWDWVPQADFEVSQIETKESIPYIKTYGTRINGISRSTMPVGYFDAPAPGKYLLTNLFTYRFVRDDEIRVRKHQSFLQSYLSIAGIAGGLFLVVWSVIRMMFILFDVMSQSFS